MGSGNQSSRPVPPGRSCHRRRTRCGWCRRAPRGAGGRRPDRPYRGWRRGARRACRARRRPCGPAGRSGRARRPLPPPAIDHRAAPPAPGTRARRRPRSRRWSSRHCNPSRAARWRAVAAASAWRGSRRRIRCAGRARRPRGPWASPDGPDQANRGAGPPRPPAARPAAPPPAGRRRRVRRRRCASGTLGEGNLLPASALGRHASPAADPQHGGDEAGHTHGQQGPAEHPHDDARSGRGRRGRRSASPQTTARYRADTEAPSARSAPSPSRPFVRHDRGDRGERAWERRAEQLSWFCWSLRLHLVAVRRLHPGTSTRSRSSPGSPSPTSTPPDTTATGSATQPAEA